MPHSPCVPSHPMQQTPTARKPAGKDDSFFGAFQGLSLDGLTGGTQGSPISAASAAGGDPCKVMWEPRLKIRHWCLRFSYKGTQEYWYLQEKGLAVKWWFSENEAEVHYLVAEIMKGIEKVSFAHTQSLFSYTWRHFTRRKEVFACIWFDTWIYWYHILFMHFIVVIAGILPSVLQLVCGIHFCMICTSTCVRQINNNVFVLNDQWLKVLNQTTVLKRVSLCYTQIYLFPIQCTKQALLNVIKGIVKKFSILAIFI